MASDFYAEWLEVAPGPRPPDYYTLLGVEVFCRDQDAIEKATRRQLTRLDEFALYPDRDTRDAVQDMMNAVARARVDLVNPKRRLTYDSQLAQRLGVAIPAEPAPAVQAETQIAPPPAVEAQPAAEDVDDVAAQFETRVWAHLQKWKLNAHEQRLLMAEAAALGVSEDEALGIIQHKDGEAEILAEKKYKRQIRLVVTLAAAAVVAVIAGAVIFILTSQRIGASNEKIFLAAVEAARERLDRGDLDTAEKELAKAEAILPGDPRLEETATELAVKRKAVEKAFTGMLSRARLLTSRGDVDQAESELAEAKAIFSDDPRLVKAANDVTLKRESMKNAFAGMLSQARLLVNSDKLDRAESELAKAGAIFPDDPKLKEVRNEVAIKRKAMALRREAMEQSFKSILSKARVLTDRGELDQAESELADAKAIFPDDPRLKKAAIEVAARQVMKKALEDIRLGRYTDAIAACRKTLTIKPDHAEAHYCMGKAYGALKKHTDAVAAYKKAIAIKPDHDYAYNYMGISCHYLGRYTDAIAAYRKAVALKPNNASAYYNIGLAYSALRRYADAIDAYKKVIAIQPSHANAHYNIGNIHRSLRQYTNAVAAYKMVIAIRPGDANAHYYLGATYDDLGRYAEALSAFRKATAIKPDHLSALNDTGVAYSRLGRYAEAVAAYSKAIAVKPDYTLAINNMGIAYRGLGRYTYAIAAHKKALTFKPNDAKSHYLMGKAYAGYRQYGFAVVAYKKAIAINANYADAYYYMGKAYEELKKYTSAIAALEKAIALQPTGRTADLARKTISTLRRR